MEWDRARIRALRAALRLPQDRFAERLGAAKKTIANWEQGLHPPSLALIRALDALWESASTEQQQRFRAHLSRNGPVGEGRAIASAGGGTLTPEVDRGEPRTHQEVADWATWFGVRLAFLTTTIDGWRGELFEADGLQTLVHQELLMSDALGPEAGNASHAISRREALVALAALPLALCAPLPSGLASGAATELFLTRCAASLTACWQLLRGSELDTVDRIVSGYVLTLDALARQGSRYQRTAARLASQAHRVAGVVTLHRGNLEARRQHYQQALYHADLAGDPVAEVSAMMGLGYTYYRAGEYVQAAHTHERALAHSHATPLQRCRLNAELAVVHAEMHDEQEALRALGLAEELFPDNPERDPSDIYSQLPVPPVLEKGLTYVSLAERFPGHGYERAAWTTFEQIERPFPSSPFPDRVRFEIVNHQARTAVLLNDLDAFEVYLHRGLDGVVLLKSRPRREEAWAVWRRAGRAWPGDPRVKALEDRLRQPI